MKTKHCEELTIKYKGTLDSVQIGIDDTDHIVFICPKCEKPLEVIEVKSKNIPITIDGKTKDNCTWVYVVCNNCKTLNSRKFYWKSEDGRFCVHKTFKSQEEKKKNGKKL